MNFRECTTITEIIYSSWHESRSCTIWWRFAPYCGYSLNGFHFNEVLWRFYLPLNDQIFYQKYLPEMAVELVLEGVTSTLPL